MFQQLQVQKALARPYLQTNLQYLSLEGGSARSQSCASEHLLVLASSLIIYRAFLEAFHTLFETAKLLDTA